MLNEYSTIPTLAIIGRPNVGKSTLFNCLTKTRDALVANQSGLTRDRQYGFGYFEDKTFIVIDTGGIGEEVEAIDDAMSEQSWKAADEADVILFLVDARAGVMPADLDVVQRLRKIKKQTYLIMNKIDGIDVDIAAGDFYQFGFGKPVGIAASHRRGIQSLLKTVLEKCPKTDEYLDENSGTSVAIIGRPNVGKSTLINRILGEERVTVFDQPGTTRDSIFIPMERRGKKYTLIDTAGVRRRTKVTNKVEKFSIIKTLQAIEKCNVVVFIMDASDNITDQELKLIGHIIDSGKALVIAVNKWDGLSSDQREMIKKELNRRLVFLDYAAWHFISALHGTGVGNLFESIDLAYESAMKVLSTPKLTKILEQAVERHNPPIVKGRRIKLRYAHCGGHNPPIVVIHGKQVDSLPASYKKYLEKTYRKRLNLVGTPIRIELRADDNPYR